MANWDERDHPRDGEGQFTEKWAQDMDLQIEAFLNSPSSRKTARESYTRAMIEEADSYLEIDQDEEDYERDDDLAGQVDIVERELLESPGTSSADRLRRAVEHLRGMLLISYADENELPPRPPDSVWED